MDSNNYIPAAKEIGLIILPDDKTSLQAQKLKNLCLKNLASTGLINVSQYEISYPNTFHLTLFQLKIHSDKLSQLYEILKNAITDIKKINFYMNNALEDSRHHIFWNSTEAESSAILRNLHKTVVENAKELRDTTQLFDRIQGRKLTEQESQSIADFGIFWGLPHNFTPHITILYDSVNSENRIKTQECLRDVRVKNPQLFRAKSFAIGELGYSGNVLSLLKTFEL